MIRDDLGTWCILTCHVSIQEISRFIFYGCTILSPWKECDQWKETKCKKRFCSLEPENDTFHKDIFYSSGDSFSRSVLRFCLLWVWHGGLWHTENTIIRSSALIGHVWYTCEQSTSCSISPCTYLRIEKQDQEIWGICIFWHFTHLVF